MQSCPVVERILQENVRRTCPTIVLASQSPNRKALLEECNIKVITRPQDIDEICGFTEPKEVVKTLANQKLSSYLNSPDFDPSLPALGVDTLVCMDGVLLGKPHSEKEAHKMLSALSGRQHEVLSGLSVYDPRSNLVKTVCETSIVKFENLSEKDIALYIKTGDPFGAAGAYKIQSHGYKIIESIQGSFSNIIGLPLEALVEILK